MNLNRFWFLPVHDAALTDARGVFSAVISTLRAYTLQYDHASPPLLVGTALTNHFCWITSRSVEEEG